jgi:sodium transport system permease protein
MNDVSSPRADAAQPAARRLSGFSFARQGRLTRKELAETLRDRRTIITLVLMPILVYPLLSIMFRQFLTASLGKPAASLVLIGVENDEHRSQLESWLTQGEHLLREQRRYPEEALTAIEPPVVAEPAYEDIRFAFGNAEEKLRQGRIDLVLRPLSDPGEPPHWQILYPERSPLAAAGRSFVERRLRAVNEALGAALSGRTAGPSIRLEHKPLAVGGAARSLLPSVVPLVLLLMTITGAVYPAIDLTAGERERGTLEALIAAPVSRLGVLIAKYVAVLAVALLTASVNLVAMSLTLYGTGLAGLVVGSEQSLALLAIEVFGLLLLFASFFSAVLLAVTSFARSFKEAQAYLIPLMLVTLAPGVMSLSPSLELNGLLASVPLMNVVLLARDVFAGTAQWLTALIVIVSTGLYAALFLSIAARVFGSDAILYGSGGSWSDLLRRPQQAARAPSPTAAALSLALVFAGTINLAGTASLLVAEASPLVQFAVSATITVLLYVLIPLTLALLERVPPRRALRLRIPSPVAVLSAGLLGVSLGVLVVEVMVLTQHWKLITLNPAITEAIEKKSLELNRLPLGMLLLMLSVVPAISEELFFRGYLFAALLRKLPAWGTIAVSAAAFALFHTVGMSGLTLERTLPSLLMGLALGWLAWRSGSVWPGMLLHTLNNALLLCLARYRDTLVAGGFLPADSQHLPVVWLAAAAIAALLGGMLLAWSRSSRADQPAYDTI